MTSMVCAFCPMPTWITQSGPNCLLCHASAKLVNVARETVLAHLVKTENLVADFLQTVCRGLKFLQPKLLITNLPYDSLAPSET